ncbi:MAG: peptidoglycan DD-metalloendopeptidase family protein [Erythrobacter sp.]|nr:peptidoglycan DD-metalloendopeptidase family protein [Erythrobacter sp.]
MRSWFPDREFFMRAEGQVRFIRVSSRLQMTVAGSAAGVALFWAASMGVMAWGQYSAEASLASFEQEKAQIATKEERLEAYASDMDRVVDELRARQDFLDAMQEALPKEIRDAGLNVTDSSQDTAETVEKIGELFPEARGLAEIEARQIAFVENVTRYAEWRARRAEAAIRKLDLDPKMMARNIEKSAVGGPFVPLGAGVSALDPRFERMGLSLARMATLERALDGIPQVIPAANESISSGFGYRRDPFNGRGAMHAGLDFRGPFGSPIYAAAVGKVIRAGRHAGYGNLVEISHGNGLTTRYAHMSRIDVKVGETVRAGETIGGLGSTGRSTGPHLHFEVRLNNRAVNPRPFLESAPDVLKEARGGSPLEESRRAASTPGR